VYERIRDGKLPSVRIGQRAVRVPKAKLNKSIAQRTSR
jgi:hypothetical protein